MKNNLERAIEWAVHAHHGQTDKGGQPYILHPLRVMMAMGTDDERITAVLHDIVEDTKVTLDQIQTEFGDRVALIVQALTRQPNEDYAAFINRCSMNDIAAKVKRADLIDNMDLSRLNRPLTQKDMDRMNKYRAALAALGTVEIERGIDGVMTCQ
jgi:(p)ppGpp synthase/HD superfamily hydrolase